VSSGRGLISVEYTRLPLPGCKYSSEPLGCNLPAGGAGSQAVQALMARLLSSGLP
jgi:hypothetical protein